MILQMVWPEKLHIPLLGNLYAPNVITYYDATKIAADSAMKSWQRKWDQDISVFLPDG